MKTFQQIMEEEVAMEREFLAREAANVNWKTQRMQELRLDCIEAGHLMDPRLFPVRCTVCGAIAGD